MPLSMRICGELKAPPLTMTSFLAVAVLETPLFEAENRGSAA